MYESFYNLKEKPFDLHPDPDYLFMSEGHDNAYTHLEYAISENKGFVVITGEIGSGKTTLINYFLHKIQQDVLVGLINNTHAPLSQLIKMICQEFELDIDGLNKLKMLNVFHEFLIQQFSLKKRVVLIIDEAQNLSARAIEEIRLISNLETEKNHLIQIILVGQPELKLNLQKKELEQFAQRVTVYCHLEGLKQDEAEKYIHFRLKIAGAQNPDIFDQDAVLAIYEFARGKDISIRSADLKSNRRYIKNRLKAEIARSLWGNDKYYIVLLEIDNQYLEALKLFPEAEKISLSFQQNMAVNDR